VPNHNGGFRFKLSLSSNCSSYKGEKHRIVTTALMDGAWCEPDRKQSGHNKTKPARTPPRGPVYVT